VLTFFKNFGVIEITMNQQPLTSKQLQTFLFAIKTANTNSKGVKKMPRGRPRKTKSSEFENVTLTPVANGYTLKSTTTGAQLFVFADLDEAFKFIRAKLKPTVEQSDFLKEI
jgi:hypothetical protein